MSQCYVVLSAIHFPGPVPCHWNGSLELAMTYNVSQRATK